MTVEWRGMCSSCPAKVTMTSPEATYGYEPIFDINCPNCSHKLKLVGRVITEPNHRFNQVKQGTL